MISNGSRTWKSEAAAQRQVVGLQVLQGPGVPGRPGRPEAGWLQRLAGQLLPAVISCRRACADGMKLNVERMVWWDAAAGGSRQLGSMVGWLGRRLVARWADAPTARKQVREIFSECD